MSFAPSSHRWAMGVGAAGAMVEVTSDVVLDQSIQRSWGRQSTFSDTAPGTFAFTLDNRDGKYTPDNAASSLVTKVTEGMRVSWDLNGHLRSGVIRSVLPYFPQDVPEAARVRVTVHDVLGVAGRTSFDTLIDGMVQGATALASWPLGDPVGSLSAADNSGRNRPPMTPYYPDVAGATVTFGNAPVPAVGKSSALLSMRENTGGIDYLVGLRTGPVTYNYLSAANYGVWGAWIRPGAVETRFSFEFQTAGIPSTCVVRITGFGEVYFGWNGSEILLGLFGTGFHYYSVAFVDQGTSGGNILALPSIDNVIYGSGRVGPSAVGTSRTVAASVDIHSVPGDPGQTAVVSMVTHTQYPTRLYAGFGLDPASRLSAIASTVPGLVLDTLPADLSPATMGEQSSGSALDAFNGVLRGEQGHIWSETTGTLLAPVEKVKIRGRTRPTAVTATFSTSSDISGSPELSRDTANMVSSVTGSGAGVSVVYSDIALIPKVGSANASISAPYSSTIDLEALAQDRLLRGINVGTDVTSITIDAAGTNSNRWATLVALTPGLRYQITNMPTTQFGSSTWDGWFLGASEDHSNDTRNTFTLYFERTLAPTGIFDTDRFMAGGEMYLSNAINSSVTTMNIATAGARFTTTGGDLPLDIVMGSEQMRVTAVSSATPQVFTISRGVNGTAAVAHSIGETLELVTQTLYAY